MWGAAGQKWLWDGGGVMWGDVGLGPQVVVLQWRQIRDVGRMWGDVGWKWGRGGVEMG